MKEELCHLYRIVLPIPAAARQRHGSAASLLLGLRVQILPGHGCLAVERVAYSQVEVCNRLITCQRSPTKFGVSECNCEDSIMRWPCCAMEWGYRI